MTLATGGHVSATNEDIRSVSTSLLRGFRERCPRCGEGAIFRAYLKVNDNCPACDEALYHQRADDAPPYVTMLLVGHVLMALYVATEDYGPALPAWTEVLIFCVVGVAMSLLLLPRVKGALIGLQWALRMHGFHGPKMDVSAGPSR